MSIDFELPTNPEAERQLLSALLLMLPQDRDAAVRHISAVWFSDPWHERFFNVLVRNRGRDFGEHHLADAKETPADRTAWWISQLLCGRDGESVAGRPQCWQEYAYVVEKLYRYRVKILCGIEAIKDLSNAARSETNAIRNDSISDARPANGSPRT